jgi:hypothetical protein
MTGKILFGVVMTSSSRVIRARSRTTSVLFPVCSKTSIQKVASISRSAIGNSPTKPCRHSIRSVTPKTSAIWRAAARRASLASTATIRTSLFKANAIANQPYPVPTSAIERILTSRSNLKICSQKWVTYHPNMIWTLRRNRGAIVISFDGGGRSSCVRRHRFALTSCATPPLGSIIRTDTDRRIRRQYERLWGFVQDRKIPRFFEDFTMLWIDIDNDDAVTVLLVMRQQPLRNRRHDRRPERIVEKADQITFRRLE